MYKCTGDDTHTTGASNDESTAPSVLQLQLQGPKIVGQGLLSDGMERGGAEEGDGNISGAQSEVTATDGRLSGDVTS